MGATEGEKIEVEGPDLITVRKAIEILGKKGSITGLTIDEMKMVGEAIILLEDWISTVELNVEKQSEQKRTQAQLPPATPEAQGKPAPRQESPKEPPKEQKGPKEIPTEVYRKDQQKPAGPAVQAPPRQSSPPQMSKEGQTKIVGKEPPKETPVEPAKAAPAPAPIEKKPELKPVEQPKQEEPEIPKDADLRCTVCRVIITPQQAKLSRLLTNKDLCKPHMEELTKGTK